MDFQSPADRPVYTPPGGPPQVERPSPEIYAHMGEANIFKMSEDFYQELGQSSVAALFPEDLVAASKKQAAFLVGLVGGPPLYQQQYGHPRLRARHLPFPISEADRQEWLRCFRKVLEHPERYDFPEEHLSGFLDFLDGFSTWMVNKL